MSSDLTSKEYWFNKTSRSNVNMKEARKSIDGSRGPELQISFRFLQRILTEAVRVYANKGNCQINGSIMTMHSEKPSLIIILNVKNRMLIIRVKSS